MKLNENELNYILLECLDNMINEDGNFNKPYINKTLGRFGQKAPSSTINKLGVGGKELAKGAAAWTAGGMTAGLFGGNGISNAILLLGGAALIKGITSSIITYNKLKNMKMPVFFKNAGKYAKYAVAEKTKAQKTCIQLQTNLHSAIAAYNQVFQTQISWDDIFQGNEYLKTTTFQAARVNGGNAENQTTNVQYDRDFSDKYAGKNESKKREQILEAVASSIITQQIEIFNEIKINNGTDEDTAKYEAMLVLRKAAAEYQKAYGVWMGWVRYINVLVKKFAEQGMTWENVINGDYSKSNNKFSDKIEKLKNTYSTGDDEEYQAENEVLLQCTEVNWECKRLNADYTGYLLKQLNSGVYYFIPNNLVNNNNLNQITQGSLVKYLYVATDIKNGSVIGKNNNSIKAWLMDSDAIGRMENL